MTGNAVSMRRPRKIRTTQMQAAQNEVPAKIGRLLKTAGCAKIAAA